MTDRPFWRSRWWMPAFSLALGALFFAAFAVGGGGDAGPALVRHHGRGGHRVRVVIMVLFGALLVEVAQGRDASPYAQVMRVGGVAYLAAVLILRHRS